MSAKQLLASAAVFVILAVSGRCNARRPLHQITPAGEPLAPLVKDRWAK